MIRKKPLLTLVLCVLAGTHRSTAQDTLQSFNPLQYSFFWQNDIVPSMDHKVIEYDDNKSELFFDLFSSMPEIVKDGCTITIPNSFNISNCVFYRGKNPLLQE
jgi:hypothetical protein